MQVTSFTPPIHNRASFPNQPRTNIEPPPPGYNPNADVVDLKTYGKALATVASVGLGIYAGLSTGVGAGVAGAVAGGLAGAGTSIVFKAMDELGGGSGKGYKTAAVIGGLVLGGAGALIGANTSSALGAIGLGIAGVAGGLSTGIIAEVMTE